LSYRGVARLAYIQFPITWLIRLRRTS